MIFSLIISTVPALLPVIALKEMRLSAAQLGLVFACVGSGHSRERCSPSRTSGTGLGERHHFDRDGDSSRRAACDGVHPPGAGIDACTAFAGAAWALAGSEIWVAGQRVMPGWVRGRMNSFQIVLGQGSMAVGAAIWGTGAADAGLDLTFAAAALVALAGVALGHRFSINFATEARVEAAPLGHTTISRSSRNTTTGRSE